MAAMRAATLLLILLFVVWQAKNGHAHEAAMIDIVSTQRELVEKGGVGVGVEPTIIRARKMAMAIDNVRKDGIEIKRAAVGSSKISTGNHQVAGNLNYQDGKEAMNAASKRRVAEDITEAAFVSFSTDYHAPRHHPPRHN